MCRGWTVGGAGSRSMRDGPLATLVSVKYCPDCGVEYRSGYDRCADCQVALVDQPPILETVGAPPTYQERVVVFRSGRRIDAELVRARLEADGLAATIWSSGLGPYRMESALTEVTGVPNDFNAHQVVVDADHVERALEVLGDAGAGVISDDADDEVAPTGSWMSLLGSRSVLIGFALFMLLVIVVVGNVQG